MQEWFSTILFLPTLDMSIRLVTLIFIGFVAGFMAPLNGGVGFSTILVLLLMNVAGIPYMASISTANLCIMSISASYLLPSSKNAPINWLIVLYSTPGALLGLVIGYAFLCFCYGAAYYDFIFTLLNIIFMGYVVYFCISFAFSKPSSKKHGAFCAIQSIASSRISKLNYNIGLLRPVNIIMMFILGFLPGIFGVIMGSGSPLLIRVIMYEMSGEYVNLLRRTAALIAIFLSLMTCFLYVFSGIATDIVLSLVVMMSFIISTQLSFLLFGYIDHRVTHCIAACIFLMFVIYFLAIGIAQPSSIYSVLK